MAFDVVDQLKELGSTIKNASESSEKLTKSISKATWVAAIVGGLGVLVAIINLVKSF